MRTSEDPLDVAMAVLSKGVTQIIEHAVATAAGPVSTATCVHIAFHLLFGPETDAAAKAHRLRFFRLATPIARKIVVDATPDDQVINDRSGITGADLRAWLQRLQRRPATAAVIDLSYFGGLTRAETAKALDISERCVVKHVDIAHRGFPRRRHDA